MNGRETKEKQENRNIIIISGRKEKRVNVWQLINPTFWNVFLKENQAPVLYRRIINQIRVYDQLCPIYCNIFDTMLNSLATTQKAGKSSNSILLYSIFDYDYCHKKHMLWENASTFLFLKWKHRQERLQKGTDNNRAALGVQCVHNAFLLSTTGSAVCSSTLSVQKAGCAGGTKMSSIIRAYV